MRKCFCDNFVKGQPYQNGQCRICWLYSNDKKYKMLIDNPNQKTSNFIPVSPKDISNFKNAIQKHKDNGFKNVTEETYGRRLKTCEGCEHRTKDWRCGICNCFLTLKAKWETEDCPLGKWALPMATNQTSNGDCDCAKK